MTGAPWLGLVSGTAVVFMTLLFARAVIHKLWDFTAFAGYVADYRLLPASAASALAALLAGLELATVVALIVPGGQVLGTGFAVFLLLAYASGMVINLSRGRDRIECGCGGAVQVISRTLVLRNLALAALASAGFLDTPYDLPALPAAVTVFAGCSLWIVYVLVDQTIANAAYLRRRA